MIATGIGVVFVDSGGDIRIECGFCAGADDGISFDTPHSNGVVSCLVVIGSGVVFRWCRGNALSVNGAFVGARIGWQR